MIKLATIAYVPPQPKFHPAEFASNVRKWRTAHPVLLFSDNWPDAIQIRNPESNIKRTDHAGRLRPFAINNLLFFTAMRIAVRESISHIIYIESDSRVRGDLWDERIFEEFFEHPHAVIGGSMVCYNPCNSGPEAYKRWGQVVAANVRKNYPIPTYGWKGAADNTGSCVFVNGSLGVYDVEWMKRNFNLENTGMEAVTGTAWDMEIGNRLWAQFGVDSYDFVAHMTSVFSSYGEVLTTEKERLEMLARGEVCAVHQVKSGAVV